MKSPSPLALLALLFAPACGQQAGEPRPADTAYSAGERAEARQRVIAIVNQPVTRMPRTEEAGVFSPGWFHSGAIEPDFTTVDVRTTQEFPYQNFEYVTSDVSPSDMFVANELEFNAMTKFFYTDLTVPKKRLTESEMIEINRLYRIIADGNNGRSG